MCSFIPFVTTMSALMSSMILTTIAIDRYQGVVLLSGKWDPKLSTGLFIIGGLWLAAAGRLSQKNQLIYFTGNATTYENFE